jgi:tryptophan-rich sensory protein
MEDVYYYDVPNETVIDTIISGPNVIDFIIVVLGILLLGAITLAVIIIGSGNAWFQALNKGTINIWVIWTLWIVATILSYIGLFIFYAHAVKPCVHSFWPDQQSQDYVMALLFLVNGFLSLGWAAIFFYIQNIGLSFWLVSVPFIFLFWVFVYMWSLSPLAAFFLIPLLAFYVFLFFAVGRLASINNVPL